MEAAAPFGHADTRHTGDSSMRKMNKKAVWLMLAAVVPGFGAWSCSGMVTREVRDAAVTGTASFVEQSVFDLLDRVFPPEETQP